MAESEGDIEAVARMAYEAYCAVRDPWWHPSWSMLFPETQRAWCSVVLVIRLHDAGQAAKEKAGG